MSLYTELNTEFKKMISNCALDSDSKDTLLNLADDMQQEHDQSMADQLWASKQ